MRTALAHTNISFMHAHRALFQYKDGIILSYQYMGNFHVTGKTANRTFFLQHGAAHAGKTASLY